MHALVQNNQIVKFFNYPKSFELNGNKYSSKIFSLFSNEEKNAIGIYEVEYDHSNKKDEGYFINTNEQFKFENNKVISYFGTATPKQLEDVNAVDEDGEPVLTRRSTSSYQRFKITKNTNSLNNKLVDYLHQQIGM
jgi:hypothetical protein